jgi:hypothetical protein
MAINSLQEIRRRISAMQSASVADHTLSPARHADAVEESDRACAVITADALEQTEADIITHIRTAGMKKARENQLVESMMKLRRDRRRALADAKHRVEQVCAHDMIYGVQDLFG